MACGCRGFHGAFEGCHIVGSSVILVDIDVGIAKAGTKHQCEASEVAVDVKLYLDVSANDGVVWRWQVQH